LAAHGIPVIHAGPPPATGSRAIRRHCALPDLGSEPETALSGLLDITAETKADYLVPCSDSALQFIVSHHDALARHLKLACPPPGPIRAVLDKERTLAVARALDIPTPVCFEISSPAEISKGSRTLPFPLVAKPAAKDRAARFKVRYFQSSDELAREFATDPDFGRHHLFQEYCAGPGVGVQVLLHRDDPVLTFQHSRLREYPVSGGVSVVAESETVDPWLLEYSLRLLRAIGWQGVAMVEFKHDPATGRVVLMEVNGRFWGTVALPVFCGIDFPYAQWRIDHGLEIAGPSTYSAGVRARWTAGAIQNLGEARHLRDLLPRGRDMLFSWSDPIPAVRENTAVFVRCLAAMARRVLPEPLRAAARPARRLDVPVKLRLWRRRRRREKGRRGALPNPVRRILFLCHGNIIRSPMAEHLCRRLLPPGCAVTIRSGGLFAQPGRPADSRAVVIAAEFGIDLAGHCATPVDESMAGEADWIVVMDHFNEAVFLRRFPRAESRLSLLGEFSAEPLPGDEIADPYLGTDDEIRVCYRLIDSCVQRLAAEVRKRGA
jgi:protein-tyrosine-phosphatase/predicted ATP-grasp superfamily ATP-dependent carboligase